MWAVREDRDSSVSLRGHRPKQSFTSLAESTPYGGARSDMLELSHGPKAARYIFFLFHSFTQRFYSALGFCLE